MKVHVCVITYSLLSSYLVLAIAEPFNFTLEISNKQTRSRSMEIISSTTPWFSLQQKLAEILNVYQGSLHVQYRLSCDSKDKYPCDLTSHQHLDTMLTVLRPLIIPARLANGRRSTRPMKAVAVQVFVKGNELEPTQSVSKVSC